jgi:hypothetical protein
MLFDNEAVCDAFNDFEVDVIAAEKRIAGGGQDFEDLFGEP